MEAAMDRGNARQSAGHTQVKVSVDPGIAAAFKAACAASKVSMAAEFAQFMAGYAGGSVKRKAAPDYSTRRRRRNAIKAIIKELELIRASEEACRDNTPENLTGSAAHDIADEAVCSLDEAIDILSAFWMVP